MEYRPASRHEYSPYIHAYSEQPSTFPSFQRYHYPFEQNERQYVPNHNMGLPYTTHVPRKPVPPVVGTFEVEPTEDQRIMINDEEKTSPYKVIRRVYWAAPFAAILLFVIGLAAAIGHYVYFTKLNERSVGDQTWTLRYSLAIAFIFKWALAASISVALAQHAWFKLRHHKMGIPVSAIDAMFLAELSLLRFLSPSLWGSAASIGLMAACIWFMPLTAIIAPTALTIGTSLVNSTDEGCIVPTLGMGIERDSTRRSEDVALFVTTDGDMNFKPSIISERITSSVLANGRQTEWESPCGPNCTYDLEFTGPSWQCILSENVDDPKAPWETSEYDGSYWYLGRYGDGSNITVTESTPSDLIYSPIYTAGMNPLTNQFWAGFAAGFGRGIDPSIGFEGKSLREMLDVHAYHCQVVNTSYTMQVDFNNGLQTNTLLRVNPFSTFEITSGGWEGLGHNVPIALQDVIGLYIPMITTLSGTIQRDPRSGLNVSTSIGLVQPLVQNLPNFNVTYASETPYIPRDNFGSLLEELSHNLTISLLSDPALLVTTTTAVVCHKTLTVTVWKFHWRPLVIAYATGLGVTLICLFVGAHALVSNGVAHDMSFSSVVRTTRGDELKSLAGINDVGGLPLPKHLERRRLRLLDGELLNLTVWDPAAVRNGFVLKN